MQEQATITATEAQIKEIFKLTGVGYHSELYLNVENERLRLLAGAPDSSSGAFVEDISGSTEAYLKVPQVESWLSVVSDGPSTVLEFTFFKGGDGRLADQLEFSPIEGDGQVSVMLEDDHVLESVPSRLPDQFNEQNDFLHPMEDRPAKVSVETYTRELQRIIEAVDIQEGDGHYPIVVRGDDLILDVGDERSERIQKTLQAQVENADNHDVDNLYGGAFDDVISTLSGQIIVQTENNAPVLLLQEKNHINVRHVIGTAQSVM